MNEKAWIIFCGNCRKKSKQKGRNDSKDVYCKIGNGDVLEVKSYNRLCK